MSDLKKAVTELFDDQRRQFERYIGNFNNQDI